ncbi:aspartate kinase [Paeniglutamicibacter sp. NPDC012692]|uniref:aspartate kinase n=1 Tax=Paeniglutamicibacter sp. NPDC012692 TaxID=3364388 RepID=UPI0036937D7F
MQLNTRVNWRVGNQGFPPSLTGDSLIVQKYGGSSIENIEGIQRVARRIVDTHLAGHPVAVVLSAMGDTTDELLDLAAGVAPLRASRELDLLLSTGERISVALLAIAISSLGASPHVFTGNEAGLITDETHGKARIVGVYPQRVRDALDRGEIPIVTGFQGTSRRTNEVTTLGRGGSDLSAVALTAALNAGVCEIYSDVDGVYTADPRIVPLAQKIDMISNDQMLELAAGGAKVLQLRCVEYARRFGVSIHVRSSFDHGEGTLVVATPTDEVPYPDSESLEQPFIRSVTDDRSAVQLTVTGVPDLPGKAAQIFRITEAAKACPDMITQNYAAAGHRPDIAFTVPSSLGQPIFKALSEAQSAIGFHSLQCDEVGRLSLIGSGMLNDSGVFCRFMSSLSEAGVSLRLISNSDTRISAVTDIGMLDQAVRAVHKEFRLSGDLLIG